MIVIKVRNAILFIKLLFCCGWFVWSLDVLKTKKVCFQDAKISFKLLNLKATQLKTPQKA
jgi:hypothetical protein